MRFKIKEKWESFTVEIHVETRDEARELWHRLGVDLAVLKANLSSEHLDTLGVGVELERLLNLRRFRLPTEPSEGVRGIWVLMGNAIDSMPVRNPNGTVEY